MYICSRIKLLRKFLMELSVDLKEKEKKMILTTNLKGEDA